MNQIHLYETERNQIVNAMKGKETQKVFIVEAKEVVSYEHVVIGAKSAKEAISMFEEHHELWDDESGITIFQREDSHSYHRSMKPTIDRSLKVRLCAFANVSNRRYAYPHSCERIVPHDQNVCQTCVEAMMKSEDVE